MSKLKSNGTIVLEELDADAFADDCQEVIFKTEILLKRRDLLNVALDYIRNGKKGTQQDRLRAASDLSQVPLRTLEIELERSEV